MLKLNELQAAEDDNTLFDLIEDAIDGAKYSSPGLQISFYTRLKAFLAVQNKDLPRELRRKLEHALTMAKGKRDVAA